MALTPTNRGTGGSSTTGTSYAFSPPQNCTAGAMVEIAFGYDNSGSGGIDPLTAFSDSHGNTWTLRQNGTRTQASAANDGCCMRVYTTAQNVATLTTSSVITANFGTTSVPVKAFAFREITGSSGTPTYVTGGVGTGSSASPNITTGSITTPDAVLASLMIEVGNNETITPDADSTNGTWGTAQTIAILSNTAGGTIFTQSKVTTGTGTQSFDTVMETTNNRDHVIAWIQITEAAATAIVPIIMAQHRMRG